MKGGRRICEFSAVILAGGKSLRMGRDKARLEFRGRSLLEHQIATVRALTPVEILISGRAGEDYARLGVPILLDRYPDAGPLAGVERALAECRASLLLVLAVDLPHMTEGFLRSLLAQCRGQAGVVPWVRERFEPLAAFYPKSAHAMAETMLRTDRRAMHGFARACLEAGHVARMPCPNDTAAVFANWNSPADIVGNA